MSHLACCCLWLSAVKLLPALSFYYLLNLLLSVFASCYLFCSAVVSCYLLLPTATCGYQLLSCFLILPTVTSYYCYIVICLVTLLFTYSVYTDITLIPKFFQDNPTGSINSPVLSIQNWVTSLASGPLPNIIGNKSAFILTMFKGGRSG